MISLICGRSRAGKTTYSKAFRDVLHLDNYGRGVKAYPKVIERVEQSDGNIIVDGIYDTPERRKALLDAFHGDGGKVCIWLDTPLDVIEQRFGRWKPSNFPRPFEPPTLSEGWDEIVVIRGDDEQRIDRIDNA